MKLTKAQRDLLERLRDKPAYVADFYAPFRKLKEAGLVAEREGKYSAVAYITDAGISALTHEG